MKDSAHRLTHPPVYGDRAVMSPHDAQFYAIFTPLIASLSLRLHFEFIPCSVYLLPLRIRRPPCDCIPLLLYLDLGSPCPDQRPFGEAPTPAPIPTSKSDQSRLAARERRSRPHAKSRPHADANCPSRQKIAARIVIRSSKDG